MVDRLIYRGLPDPPQRHAAPSPDRDELITSGMKGSVRQHGHHDDAAERIAIAMSEAGSEVMTIRTEYRTLAVEWAEARDSPDQANRIFKAHHALYKRIRDSAAGREAIVGLLDDPVTAVRVLAATHSLAWEPDRAAQALQEIEQESSPYAVDAKWTLRSYRNGKLNLDWLPRLGERGEGQPRPARAKTGHVLKACETEG